MLLTLNARNARLNLPLAFHFLTKDLTNLSMLRHRGYDGVLVTQHQSGTHWLIHMLSEAMAGVFDLPRPERVDDQRMIVRHKEPLVYDRIPRLAHTHKIPSWLTHAPPLHRLLTFPRYVVLVRDLRASLVSCYERYGELYGVPFETYLRGDPWKRAYRKDIWRDIRFLNAWADVRRRMPGRVLLVRYEDLRDDAAGCLQRVWAHWELPPTDRSVFERAVADSSKEAMAAKQGEAEAPGHRVVRTSRRDPLEWYGPEDRRFLTGTVRAHLRDWHGYDYDHWGDAEDRRAD